MRKWVLNTKIEKIEKFSVVWQTSMIISYSKVNVRHNIVAVCVTGLLNMTLNTEVVRHSRRWHKEELLQLIERTLKPSFTVNIVPETRWQTIVKGVNI